MTNLRSLSTIPGYVLGTVLGTRPGRDTQREDPTVDEVVHTAILDAADQLANGWTLEEVTALLDDTLRSYREQVA